MMWRSGGFPRERDLEVGCGPQCGDADAGRGRQLDSELDGDLVRSGPQSGERRQHGISCRTDLRHRGLKGVARLLADPAGTVVSPPSGHLPGHILDRNEDAPPALQGVLDHLGHAVLQIASLRDLKRLGRSSRWLPFVPWDEVAVSSVLELDVSRGDAPGNYRVEVIQSPAGEASATFEFQPAEFLERLGDLQETLLASSVPSRRLMSRGETSVRDVGRRLFDALFSQQDVAGVYRASRAVAEERGESLRIVRRIGAPELAVLPWESMFDESADSYVSRREPVVRYVAVPVSPPPLRVRLPLRILAVIASPRGLAMLDVGKEREDLTRALRPLIDRGAIVVHWLEHATWPALQEALLSRTWNVVHFIGHGDFDVDQDEGVLALESEQGRVHRVSARNFVDLLREARPMARLVFLNACESSTSGRTDLFSGTAATLVRGGVSAVTAMQFEISDQAAIAFCRGFYTAIGHGHGVDEAVRSGRLAIVGLGDGSLEWITPTLYLRGQENRLFELSDSPSPPGAGAFDERRGAAGTGEEADSRSDSHLVVDGPVRALSGEPPSPTRRRRRRLVALAGVV